MILKRNHNHKGFTLIELLVAVAIIGVLSSVVLSSLNQARKKGRDAARMQSMRQIEKALVLYYSDNGVYPSTGGEWWGAQTVDCGVTKVLTGANGYVPNLAPKYIPVLPTDPNPATGCFFGYLYRSDPLDGGYKLFDAYLPETLALPSSPFYDPARPGPEIFWALCEGVVACAY